MTSSDADRLTAATAPGSRAFTRAAVWRSVGMGLLVGQWLALVALITGLGDAPFACTAGFVGALVLRLLARWRAECAAADGAHLVAAALRERIIAVALPDAGSRSPAPAEWVTQTAIELSADLAGHASADQPARRAAAPSCLLVLIACALAHWPVAVLLAAATVILPVNLRLAGLATRDASDKQLAAVRRLTAEVLERFQAMELLREFGAVGRERRRIADASAELNRRTTKVLRSAFVSAGVLDVVITLAIAVTATYVGLTGLGYLRLPLVPKPSLTEGLLVLVLAPVYFLPLREMAAGYHERERALAAVAALGEVGDEPGYAAVGPSVPVPSTGAPQLRLAELTLRHPDADQPVLTEASATAPAAGITALTGISGAGKTTLLAALAGLHPGAAGRIELVAPSGQNGSPRPGTASWIGQDTVILAGTLADNIRLGRPDAAERAVRAAALAVGLGPLLDRLPDGLDTEVGDAGFGISAGEARRVALARAVLADRSLWLLDEPTAHLDPASGAAIAALLTDLADTRTIVVATHDEAIIAVADRVWRLDRGLLQAVPR